MCLTRYVHEDSAAAAVHGLHGHVRGEMDVEVEVCQFDVRRASVNTRHGPRLGAEVMDVRWDDLALGKGEQ
eukprot:13608523-Alexandrium_andersonii.AAC.1